MVKDWNSKIIEEFRSNEGKVGGGFEGVPMLILHTKGRKSGDSRQNPLVYQQVGDDIAIFGSKGGAPTHPDWYLNVVANPDVAVEVGTERFDGRARVLTGDEREKVWTKQKKLMSGFADYESRTTREIPVILIERT